MRGWDPEPQDVTRQAADAGVWDPTRYRRGPEGAHVHVTSPGNGGVQIR